jgi:tetratricopeptide (TPR) repeat protein
MDLEQRFQEAVDAHRNGNLSFAEPIYYKVLEANPSHADAHHMCGVAHFQQGRLVEAERSVARSIEFSGSVAKVHNTYGSICNAMGRFDQALAAFDRALQLDPTFSTAAYNKGCVLLELGHPGKAAEIFRATIASGDATPEIYSNLVAALLRLNELNQAIDWCRQGLALQPDNLALHTNLVSAPENANRLDEALLEATKILQKSPGNTAVQILLAKVYRRSGNLEQAKLCIDAVAPHNKGRLDEIDYLSELGLIQDALRNSSAAFAAFKKRNELRKSGLEAQRFQSSRYLATVKEWHSYLDGAYQKPSGTGAIAAPAPVFFVGFPRSGTTLVEQVLMSHPAIVTTEENSPLELVEARIRKLSNQCDQSMQNWLGNAKDDDLDPLRRLYFEHIKRDFGLTDDQILVDKLPSNIVRLGLIERLWPNAKVLVALRDPRDVCLSCFMQRFALNDAMMNFLSLEQTGVTYSEVMGLWLKYQECLALPMMTYRYEDIVTDFEATISGVLSFIGVEWSDLILSYREDARQRVIKTPSYRDVTSPLNSKAIKRWERYESDLAQIIPLLTPLVEALGYGNRDHP